MRMSIMLIQFQIFIQLLNAIQAIDNECFMAILDIIDKKWVKGFSIANILRNLQPQNSLPTEY